MALLYLLHREEIPAFIVHCNYGLRGKASDKDQKLVEEICKLWNFECVSVRLDYEKDSHNNFQNWARDRRYEVFYDLKEEFNLDIIVTAHHQDDQIETIFQRILRGSGLSSWRGIEAFDGKLFRPLLEVSKSEIMEFVQQFNIPYRIDSTNEESTYARNFLRNNWFPELNKLFPGWRENILAVRDRAEEFADLKSLIANDVVSDTRAINRSAFLALPASVQRVIFSHTAKKVIEGNSTSAKFLGKIHKLSELQTGAKLQISDDIFVIRDRETFVVVIDVPSKFLPVQISEDEVAVEKMYSFVKLKSEAFENTYTKEKLILNLDAIEFPITLRNWQDGDRFIPFGIQGSQLISSHISNKKVSALVKKSVKVIESFDGTICAVIFPPNSGVDIIGTISEVYRCTDQTKKSLIISY